MGQCSLALLVELSILRLHSLDTDSFIQALRRLIARRGNVRQIRSDNGSNFVGTEQKLFKTFSEMDHNKIENFLQDYGGDWIT